MSGFMYSHSGDSTIIVKAGNEISVENNQKVMHFSKKISGKSITGVIEIIPAYNCLAVSYDAAVITLKKLVAILRKVEKEDLNYSQEKTEIISIPTVYGGDFGPDLGYVCAFNSLSPEEVVRIHTQKEYLIYMMGFTPGFPYLADVDQSISTPRKETPRERINAGSVGIAGNQTGIYPLETPGGWQIIGRTPLRLFDADRNPPFLLKAGQYIKFVHIGEEEFYQIESMIKKGSYTPDISYRECGAYK